MKIHDIAMSKNQQNAMPTFATDYGQQTTADKAMSLSKSSVG